MPVMTQAQREEFLAGVHVAVIGITRPGGPPLTVPIWYRYEPGGDVVVQTDPGSLKFRLVDTAREFSLAVQTETPPYRYVTVSGPVVAIEPETSRAELESMARRYLDPDATADYLDQIKDLSIATLRPTAPAGQRPRQPAGPHLSGR